MTYDDIFVLTVWLCLLCPPCLKQIWWDDRCDLPFTVFPFSKLILICVCCSYIIYIGNVCETWLHVGFRSKQTRVEETGGLWHLPKWRNWEAKRWTRPALFSLSSWSGPYLLMWDSVFLHGGPSMAAPCFFNLRLGTKALQTMLFVEPHMAAEYPNMS